mmetsp:Transcript_2782/g.6074  ORF Transcript_2782/g.6074 Transcript_2782/m.6074 type:complete len:217 (-) Transcript_2782:1601-2251(-)
MYASFVCLCVFVCACVSHACCFVHLVRRSRAVWSSNLLALQVFYTWTCVQDDDESLPQPTPHRNRTRLIFSSLSKVSHQRVVRIVYFSSWSSCLLFVSCRRLVDIRRIEKLATSYRTNDIVVRSSTSNDSNVSNNSNNSNSRNRTPTKTRNMANVRRRNSTTTNVSSRSSGGSSSTSKRPPQPPLTYAAAVYAAVTSIDSAETATINKEQQLTNCR